jgi:3-isopropylmalate dehydrogenase
MKFAYSTISALVLGGGLVNAFVPHAPSSSSRAATVRNMAVSKKESYSVTLLPGDGIGPEITAATKVVLEALCKRSGFQLETLQQCLASDSVLLACIGGYKVSVSSSPVPKTKRYHALWYSPKPCTH